MNRHLAVTALAAAALVAAQAAHAQGLPGAQPWTPPPAEGALPDANPPPAAAPLPGTGPLAPGREEPADLVARGVESLLQDFLGRAQPHLDGLANDLQGMAQEYAPALRELTGLMDDIGNYQAPERLPNGDVLIRRRPDAPPPPPLDELRHLVPPEGGAGAVAPPPVPQTNL